MKDGMPEEINANDEYAPFEPPAMDLNSIMNQYFSGEFDIHLPDLFPVKLPGVDEPNLFLLPGSTRVRRQLIGSCACQT